MTDTDRTQAALMLDRLFSGEGAFDGPENLLRGLTAEQAVTVPEGSHHSIAQSLSHVNYWLRLYLGWIELGHTTEQSTWGQDFVRPSAEEWPAIRAEFDALLAQARAIAADPKLPERTVPNDEGPVPATTLLGDLGAHNAYHLGQIVLLRRLVGAWPAAD